MVTRALRTPWSACLLLVVAYVALSFANDSRGMLGTDTGIKVGTYRAMESAGTWRPVIGYWAADVDPDATAHPFRDIRVIDGQYLDVTTLPMVVAGYPLWRLGGYRLALLLPMLGAVAAAFVARGLTRRLGGGDGWAAFWLVGLASPLLIYALDLWEHTWGVAAIAGAVLLLFDAVDERADGGANGANGTDGGEGAGRGTRWWQGLAAGALLGFAFSMRTEALVYTLTSFGIAGIVLLRRRRIGDAVVVGLTGVAGFVVLFLANAALEIVLVGQTLRGSRASGTAGAAGGDVATRLKEAVVTLFSPFPSFDPTFVIFGIAGAVALIVGAYAAQSPKRRPMAVTALAAAIVVVLVRLQSGLGFWPGLLATWPVAAIGLALGWGDGRRRLVLLLAVVPLPLVFYFQFTGGALPQWGGRYILTSGLLLTIVGMSALDRVELWFRRGVVGLAVFAALSGVLWVNVRTHEIGDDTEQINALPQAVVVFPDGFIAREFASVYLDKPWLAPQVPGDLGAVTDVLNRTDQPSFALLSLDEDPKAPDIPGFRLTGQRTVQFLDPTSFTVFTYERAAP